MIALRACLIVNLHMSLVNLEAAVQRCYTKIIGHKIWKVFKEKPVVNCGMKACSFVSRKTCTDAVVWARAYK